MSAGSLFFGGFYPGAQDAQQRVQFVLSRLERAGMAVETKSAAQLLTVIDVSAGVGDVAFGLARGGVRVLAFEHDEALYSVLFDRFCRARELNWLVAPFPMSLSEYEAPLAADAMLLSNTWSHVRRDQRRALLERVYRGLRPGGLLVMNCAQVTSLRPEQSLSPVGKRVFGALTIEHLASSTAGAGSGEQVIRFEFRMRHHGTLVGTRAGEVTLVLEDPQALRALLADVGFEQIDLRGSYSDSDYDSSLPGFVAVCRVGLAPDGR